MPPPIIFRTLRAFSTKSLEPHSSEPTGAQSPLEMQNMTESKGAASAFASTPSAAAALKMRAPSRWEARPRRFAISPSASPCATVMTVPPARLCVFSAQSRVVRGR